MWPVRGGSILADSERYTELNEAAQRQQEATNERALREVQARLQPETDPDFDGKHCVGCWGLIPKARLEQGRVRCVLCQEDKERLSKLFRR